MRSSAYYSRLLTYTYTSNSKQERLGAEEQLKSQFKNELFVQTMRDIIFQAQDENLAISAINLFRDYAHFLIMSHNQVTLAKLKDLILQLFSVPYRLGILRMLSDSLKFIFTRDNIHNIRLQNVKKIIRELLLLKEKKQQCSLNQCFYLVLNMRSLLSFPMYDILNNELFQHSFDILVDKYLQVFKSLNFKEQRQFQLCELFSELFLFYFKRTDVHSNKVLREIMWGQPVHTLSVSALTLAIGMLRGIYLREDTPQNRCLLSVQSNTLELIEIVLRYKLPNADQDKLSKQILKMVPILIERMRPFSAQIDILIQNVQAVNTLTKLLRMFQTLIRYPSSAECFSNNGNFFLQPVISFLKIPASFRQSFQDKPQLFVNSYNFIFDSSLYSDNEITDEFLALQTSISQFIIMAIEHLCVLDQIVQLCLVTLNNPSSNFDQKFICLSLLGIVSYNIGSKSDYINRIKNYLLPIIPSCSVNTDVVQQQILQTIHLMILARYTQFISDDDFIQEITSMTMTILQSHKSQSVRIITLELLIFLVKIKGRLQGSVEQLVQFLLQMSNNPVEVDRVLDILCELYSDHSGLKNNLVLNVGLTDYFIQKIGVYSADQSNASKILISKCWSIINLLVDVQSSNHTYLEYLGKIQSIVSVTYKCLSSPVVSSFQEDIIDFNVSLIKKTKTISSYQSDLIICLPTFLQKHGYDLQSMYQFILLFVQYGHHIISNSDLHQTVLFQQCIRSTKELLASRKDRESDTIKGILILQTTLLRCSQNILPAVWESSLIGIWELANLPYYYYTFTKANLASTLSLALATCRSLKNQQLISKALDKIMADRHCIDVDFASKIYVISLCWIMRGNARSPMVQIPDIVKVITSIVWVLTSSLGRMVEKPERDKEQDDYHSSICMINTQLDPINQFQMFKGAIQNMKMKNPNHFRSTIDQLDQHTRQNLVKVMKSTFVYQKPREIHSIRRLTPMGPSQ